MVARRAQSDEDRERDAEVRRAADDDRAREQCGELAGQRERPHGAARGEQGRRRLAKRRREHEHEDAGEPGERILGHEHAGGGDDAGGGERGEQRAEQREAKARLAGREQREHACEHVVERRGGAVIEARRDHRACRGGAPRRAAARDDDERDQHDAEDGRLEPRKLARLHRANVATAAV